jgi:hypothetical protein
MLATAEPAKAHVMMTSTLTIMDICCLLLVVGSLERIRFGPLREFIFFHAIELFGKQATQSNDGQLR